MTLPASGAISLNQVNTELGLTATASISMGASNVRTLFGQASGAVDMNTGHGKSNGPVITITISASIKNFNAYNNRNASQHGTSVTVSPAGAYVAGTSIVNVVVNSGVIIGSTSILTYAFDTGTGWNTGDVLTLNNSGYISGKSGLGGLGATNTTERLGHVGGAGGPSMNVQKAIAITNASGYIYSGGGGGGGGGAARSAGGSDGGDGGGSSHRGILATWNVGINHTHGGRGRPVLPGISSIYPNGGALNVNGAIGKSGALLVAWGTSCAGQGGGGGGGGASGGNGGVGHNATWIGGVGGGHGKAITGIANVSWVSGNTRIYGGTI